MKPTIWKTSSAAGPWRGWSRRVSLPLAAIVAVTALGGGAAYGKPRWSAPVAADVTGVSTVAAQPVASNAWDAVESRAIRGPREVAWPTPGETTVELVSVSADGNRVTPKAGRVTAGGLPIRVANVFGAEHVSSAQSGEARVSKAKVRVLDRAAASAAGIDGIVLAVDRVDGRTRTDKLTVEVGYRGFAHAYGGDWATRLRLVALPACVLSTPQLPECRQGTVLPTVNNAQTQTVTADATVAGARPTVLAVQSGPSGDSGDYAATPLSLAGTWNVGAQSGDFTYGYPLRMPPSLGGPAPSVSLGYSSGSLDGRTATSNNQGGWIGDGWESWPGFIERKYASCADDNPSRKTGDLCWKSSNATLSLNGRAGELIETGTPNVWRLKNDDGSRIEKLTDAARGNGDNDNEYWKVTTTDGTQYFFGYHKLPGWVDGKPATNSTWTVPVFGNNTGEPCYNSTFANAWCQQAWRWNLDYVIDPHENTMAYFYLKETGWYGRNLDASLRTDYIRGGYLARIEYGMRKNSEYTGLAPMRVVFMTAERCLSGCWTGAAWASAPNASAWPDTPYDQDCAAAPCTGKLSPTFWSARRLSKVTTQVRSSATAYRNVESWTLRHEFLNAGDNEGSPMWLRGITRAGHVTTAGGAAVTDQEITFSPGAEPLPNRVDGPTDGLASLTRFRIKTVTTEAGGTINVAYSAPDCTKTSLPTPHSNTKRCMPVYWSPAGGDPVLDWFHKYVVTSVNLHDVQYKDGNGNNVATSDDQYTFYDYLDTPAWHYTDDELTPDKYRTWGDWRGYGRVQVRQGGISGVQTAVEYRYLRGMDGDKQPTGERDVWVADTWGGSIEDHEALNGFLRQQITFNGPGGAEVNSTLHEPWKHGPTATRTSGGITVKAWKTNTATSRFRTALFNKDGSARGSRTTKVSTVYNNDGLPVSQDDFGDEAVTDDETCTRLVYARNDTTWMIDKVAQEETLSGTCAAASNPATPSTVLKRSRTFYDTYLDESSFGAAPSRGNPVRMEELDRWSSSTPVYVATASSKYDDNGRQTETIDARGSKIVTGYGADSATGLVTSTTVTNHLGHQTVSLKEPAWGLVTKVTDANLTVTDITLDGLGRTTAVWLPGRNKGLGQSANLKFTYLIRNSGGPTAVTTESLNPDVTYRKSVNLFDGFFRQRQNQLQATGGGRVITETLHNSLGQVAWISAPFYDSTNTAPTTTMGSPQGQIAGITESVYDGAGRLTAEVFKADGVEKWRTTTNYGGDRTFVTPPSGGTATATFTDARGLTTALRQYRITADLGSDDSAKFVNTSYTHDLLGQLKTVTDQAGNIWSYDYDLRGRQKQAVDPDKGTTTSTFYPDGNVEKITAPLGTGTATVAFTYDMLGRKTSMRDDTSTGNKRAEWIYDTLQYGKGKLTSATRFSGGNTYTQRTNTFDKYGRPTSTSVVLPAAESGLCAAAGNSCTYTTTLSYKPNGKLATATMPAAADLPAEQLGIGYNDVGDPGDLVTANQIYVYSVTYNKLGQLTQRQLGQYESRIAATYNFDEPTRRLTSMNVVPEDKPEAANYAYSYNNIGNITKISQAPQGQTADHQCYKYDFLRRLTEAWTPGGGNCSTTPTTAGLGGPAPYWHQWEIDDLGNRKKETRNAAAGNTTYTYTYPASGSGSVRPHAVTNVTATGTVSWSRNYTYDNAGNTKTRPNSSGTAQTLTYDKEGHLGSLLQGSATTSYLYDADGNRLIRTDPDGSKTLYLQDTEVKAVGTTKTAKRFYRHGDTTIGIRTAAGLNWIIGDHHGTSELTVKATDLNAIAKRRMLPYGEQRGSTTGTWPTGLDKGFVGGTNDPTGLTHIGARHYDTFTGRFLSVDPEINHQDPQTLHGYLYANNSPVSFVDNTGRNWGTGFMKGFVKSAPMLTFPGLVYGVYKVGEQMVQEQKNRAEAVNGGEMSIAEGALRSGLDLFMSPVGLGGLGKGVYELGKRAVTAVTGTGEKNGEAAGELLVDVIGIAGGVSSSGLLSAGRMTVYKYSPQMAGRTPHFSIKITNIWGRSRHTEQVILTEDMASTTIALQQPGLQQVVSSVTRTIPNARAAMLHQRKLLGQELGQYNLARNSCFSHCRDVAAAGGWRSAGVREFGASLGWGMRDLLQ